jgi:hypothetical protein
MSLTEILGFVTGAASVWRAAKDNVWNWPIGNLTDVGSGPSLHGLVNEGPSRQVCPRSRHRLLFDVETVKPALHVLR